MKPIHTHESLSHSLDEAISALSDALQTAIDPHAHKKDTIKDITKALDRLFICREIDKDQSKRL